MATRAIFLAGRTNAMREQSYNDSVSREKPRTEPDCGRSCLLYTGRKNHAARKPARHATRAQVTR